ncbi:plasmid mobilization relaxosome protein MobC (plasmid) [Aeromicrobium yanjiei]|uniref:Plasmid mobilization relaxosome protein MobC n=2 Tax=Aeromicrobium yanjiei TaxID=2662028 RepID=A0A5Q2M9Z9_9ACTN|nr:plasmid mobilization relaxosome protein MobC [Aeromicrobium yanjiei]
MVEATLSGGSETPTQRREAMAELFAIRRVLSNNAINVNQMAKAVNIDGVLPAEASGFLAEARTLVGRIDETLEGLATP